MRSNDRNFVGYAVTECIKKGVNILFDHKKFVKTDNIRCSGFFDEDDKELHVATLKPQRDWLPILCHEFCHFQQWSEKDPLYIKISKNDHLQNDMWDWLDGKDIPMDRVEKSIRCTQQMEFDCEQRVVEKINEFDLSIEVNNYIRISNIYILFYSLLLETRSWYIEPPYQIKELVDTVPTTFVESFDVPMKYKEIALKKCF